MGNENNLLRAMFYKIVNRGETGTQAQVTSNTSIFDRDIIIGADENDLTADLLDVVFNNSYGC